MKVGIFYNSISNPAKFSNKVMVMDLFKQGVLAAGDTVVEYHDNRLPDQQLDAGFVLGYTLEENFRKKIIEWLANQRSYSVFVDSNILHYAKSQHEWHRYSLNTVYPDTGEYFFKELDRTKWGMFSSWHGVELKPWRETGEHILVLAQRPKGFNMFTDQDQWLDTTIGKIRKHTTRPIVVRMHPRDGTRFKQIDKLQKRFGKTITISTAENIVEDLKNCWCCVGYASTPNVVSAIEGIPVYVEVPEKSWAAEVSFNDLSLIENPPMPDRTDWVNKIANIHWSNDEVKSGKLWSAIREYISSVRS